MKRSVVFIVFLILGVSALAQDKPVQQVEVKSYVTGKMIEPGSNLVIENLPSIPVELAESVRKYTETKPVFMSTWHPMKRELLTGKRVENTTQVHLLTTPLGDLKQLTNFPDPVGGGSWHPASGSYFIFFKATGGNEISQLHRYDADTGKITRLTLDDKMRIGGGPWTTAGDRYLYTSVPTGGGTTSETIKTEFYTIDPAKPDSAKLLVALDGVGWGAADWSRDDKKLLVFKYVSINESYIYLYDIATGEKTLLTPQDGTDKVATATPSSARMAKGSI